MRIIVIGAGKVGYALAEHLIAEEHDVIIIDKDGEVIERCGSSLDDLHKRKWCKCESTA